MKLNHNDKYTTLIQAFYTQITTSYRTHLLMLVGTMGTVKDILKSK